MNPGAEAPRDDAVLERNLTRLLREAYTPALPRAEFRAGLRAEVLRVHRDASGAPSIRPISPTGSWRENTRRAALRPVMLAAAAILVAIGGAYVGMLALRSGATRTDLESLLAAGDVALRTAPDAEFEAATADREIFETTYLEVVTPKARGITIEDAGGSAVSVAAESRVAFDAPPDLLAPNSKRTTALKLERGAIDALLGRDGAPFTFASRHATVALANGSLRYEMRAFENDPPGDPSAWIASSSEARLIGDGVRAGAIEIVPATGARYRDGRSIDAPTVATGAIDHGPVRTDVPPKTPDAPATVDGSPLPFSIRGKVTAHDAPVKKFVITVVFYEKRGGVPDYGLSRESFEDEGGLFEIVPGREGRARVFVVAPDLAVTVSAPFWIQTSDPPREMEFDLVTGATLRGRVVDARTEEPLEGVLVFSENEVPSPIVTWPQPPSDQMWGRTDRGVTTDAKGLFELTHVAPGNPLIRAQRRGYSPAWDSIDGVQDRSETGDIELELNAGASIRGTVRDAAGAPRAKSLIIAVNQTLGVASIGTPMAIDSTDAEGHYELADLPIGIYTAIDLGPQDGGGFDPDRIRLVSVGATGATFADFGPPRGHVALLGKLQDHDGNPLAGVSVSLAEEGLGEESATSWRSATTDDAGEFRLDGLDAGPHDLYRVLAADGVYRIGHVELRDVAEQREVFRASGATLAGEVVDAVTGAPIPVAYLVLERIELVSAKSAFAGRAPVDSNGSFRFENVAEGSYRVGVTARDDVHAVAWSDAVIAHFGAVATIRVPLPRCGGIRVEFQIGGEVVAPEFAVHSSAGAELSGLARVRKTDGGAFEVDDLPAGEAIIRISGEGFVPMETRIRVDEGRRNAATIELERRP